MRDGDGNTFLSLRGNNSINVVPNVFITPFDIIHLFCGPCLRRRDQQLGYKVKRTVITCKGVVPIEKDNDCSFSLKIFTSWRKCKYLTALLYQQLLCMGTSEMQLQIDQVNAANQWAFRKHSECARIKYKITSKCEQPCRARWTSNQAQPKQIGTSLYASFVQNKSIVLLLNSQKLQNKDFSQQSQKINCAHELK